MFAPAGSEYLVLAGSPACGSVDLLTVVAHELGHIVGRTDLDSASQPQDLMADTLGTGIRRLPTTWTTQVVAGPAVSAPTLPANLLLALGNRNPVVDAVFAGNHQSQTAGIVDRFVALPNAD